MAKPCPPKVILLDSCSYFRLGISFRPILIRLDGDPEYELKVLADLDREYSKSSRLQTKFWWAKHPEYKNERLTNCYTPHGHKAKAAQITFTYIDQYARDNGVGISLIDKRVLSAGYACGGVVVTDDTDMQGVATIFGISYFTTLDLLKLMYKRGRITVEEIDRVIDYWKDENDLPTCFSSIRTWRESLNVQDS